VEEELKILSNYAKNPETSPSAHVRAEGKPIGVKLNETNVPEEEAEPRVLGAVVSVSGIKQRRSTLRGSKHRRDPTVTPSSTPVPLQFHSSSSSKEEAVGISSPTIVRKRRRRGKIEK